MVYFKNTWENREVENPRTYTLVDNGDGTTTLVPAEGNIISQGTPIIAENMNNLETQYDESVQYTDSKVANYVKATAGLNYTLEITNLLFFTNGASSEATASVSFPTAYSVTPTIMPANITVPAAYSDVLYYPYTYNVSTTGFSCKIISTGNLGTVGSPANIFMRFFIFGPK